MQGRIHCSVHLATSFFQKTDQSNRRRKYEICLADNEVVYELRVVRSLCFIEFLRNSNQDVFDDKEFLDNFASDINSVLERKKSGYRFVGADIAPIVEQHEIEAIQECLEAPELFAGARIHIPSALQLYSNRQNPDYRNSIKEAISAIESAACVIAGNAKATLGAALKLIKKKHNIHPDHGRSIRKAVRIYKRFQRYSACNARRNGSGGIRS